MTARGRPPRLTWVFTDSPAYFVTFCTKGRAPVLADSSTHDTFRTFCDAAHEHGTWVGRYVLLPDHIHLFVRLAPDKRLGDWVGLLKRSLARETGKTIPWQDGFFDHVLRSAESYAAKWDYVWQNPVRAGLVDRAEDWPYQGEVQRFAW